VLPLASAAQAEALRARGTVPLPGDEVLARLRNGDALRTGIGIVAEIAAQLKTVPGVRGIHILSMGCETALPTIIEEARLA
jgi:hypothetical protein